MDFMNLCVVTLQYSVCSDQVRVHHQVSIKPAEAWDTALMLALCICSDCRQRMPDLSWSCLVPKLILQNIFDRWELVLWGYTGPESYGYSTFILVWGNEITSLSHSLTLWSAVDQPFLLLKKSCCKWLGLLSLYQGPWPNMSFSLFFICIWTTYRLVLFLWHLSFKLVALCWVLQWFVA